MRCIHCTLLLAHQIRMDLNCWCLEKINRGHGSGMCTSAAKVLLGVSLPTDLLPEQLCLFISTSIIHQAHLPIGTWMETLASSLPMPAKFSLFLVVPRFNSAPYFILFFYLFHPFVRTVLLIRSLQTSVHIHRLLRRGWPTVDFERPI